MNKPKFSAFITEMERVSEEEPEIFNAEYYVQTTYLYQKKRTTFCTAGIFVRNLPYFDAFHWISNYPRATRAINFFSIEDEEDNRQLFSIPLTFRKELDLTAKESEWIIMARYGHGTALKDVPIEMAIDNLKALYEKS